MDLPRHPLAEELFAELLNRPSPAINAPSVIMQWALIPKHSGGVRSPSAQQAIEQLCKAYGVPGPNGAKHHHVELGPVALRWEQHTEFSSVVLIGDEQSQLSTLPTDWLDDLDHQLLTGALITIAPASDSSVPSQWPNAVGGEVMGGAADIATTLKPNASGVVEYHVINRSLDPAQLGRLAQRLYEIETYRMFALLGLPLAKQAGETLNQLEQQLVALVETLGQTQDLTEDQRLLDALFGLAQASEQLMADTDYRFSATQAYGRIVKDRLTELREQPVVGRQALGEFLERRFEPALRTSAHIAQRQQNLSARIARTVSLARTRVEVSLQTQHRTQLEAMARRAKLQLRLQRTVEGLSVMAISYYTIGILAYLLGGWLPKSQLSWVISLLSPLLLIAIWWSLKRWRAQVLADEDGPM